MPSVTITNAKLGNAIRDTVLIGGTVDIATADAFGVGTIGYVPDAQSYKLTENGINGGAFVVVVDDDEPTAFTLTFPDTSTATIGVDGADSTQALEDLLTDGGDAPTGGTIIVEGTLNRIFGDTPRSDLRVDILLTERFATEDGVYLPVSASFKMTADGLNGADGVTLYVPTGAASQWRFEVYRLVDGEAGLLGSYTAQFDDSMGTVEIADVLDGVYVEWVEPAPPVIPDAPTSLTAVATGTTFDDVLLSWTDNSDDETGFQVQRSYDNSTWSTLTTTTANATTYTDTSPDGAQGTIYYRVCAAGTGGDSTYATATIEGWILGTFAAWNAEDLTDSAGSNDLSQSGTVGFVAGKVGNAFDIDGSNYPHIADSTALRLGGSFTIAGWFNADSALSFTALIQKGTGFSSSLDYQIMASATDIELRLGTGAGSTAATKTITLNTGTWYCFVATYNSGTNAMGISINAGTPETATFSGSRFGSSSDLYLGKSNLGGPGNLDGKMDIVVLANRDWSAANISSFYNGGTGVTYPA